MNTLTIPELNLFHSRRNSPTKRDFITTRTNVLNSHNKYNYLSQNINNTDTIKNDYNNYLNFPSLTNRGLSSQSRYKEAAENYLYIDKRVRSPTYFIEPSPYICSIPSHFYVPSPERNKKYPCQCELEVPNAKSSDRKLNKNPYVGLKQQLLPTRQPKILKEPYLLATFREKPAVTNQSKKINVKKEQKITSQQQSQTKQKQSELKQKSFAHSQSLMRQVMNSKIMQKLQTHQSNEEEEQRNIHINLSNRIQKNQASIQTQKKQNNTQSVNKKSSRNSRQSKQNVQKILLEQKMLIQSLKMQFERQNQFTFDVEDLQTTKNDYIDRSRELLFKLNQLADDKRDFALIFKAFSSDKKKHNVFSSLQV